MSDDRAAPTPCAPACPAGARPVWRNPSPLLALGRLCLAQRLWGKARSYLEASLSLAEQRAVRLELARLCEQSGRPAEALPHYRAAAGLSP